MTASSASTSWGGSFSARPVSTTIRPAWLRRCLPRSPPLQPPHRPAPWQAGPELLLFLAALHGLGLALLTRRGGLLLRFDRFRLLLGGLLLRFDRLRLFRDGLLLRFDRFRLLLGGLLLRFDRFRLLLGGLLLRFDR